MPLFSGKRRCGVYPENHGADLMTCCAARPATISRNKNKLCVRSTDALKSPHRIKKKTGSEWEDGDGCNWSGFSARANRTDEGSP